MPVLWHYGCNTPLKTFPSAGYLANRSGIVLRQFQVKRIPNPKVSLVIAATFGVVPPLIASSAHSRRLPHVLSPSLQNLVVGDRHRQCLPGSDLCCVCSTEFTGRQDACPYRVPAE
jgi:hypothetical protein